MSGNASLQAALRQRMAGELLFDEPAGSHTSIGVGGPIDALLFPRDERELTEVVAYLRQCRIPFLPVGNWTNLIVKDGGFRGALVSLARLNDRSVADQHDGTVRLSAAAGCPLAELVRVSLTEALTGIEFCAGIPGSLGGAIRMNAGAYGGEIGEVVGAVRLLDGSGTIRTVGREELAFGYRSLDLPEETIIIDALLCLRRGDKERIAARVREITETRQRKHPLGFRNAGSIFKNPRDCPAGRLIEAADLKGVRIGDAQVSEKHANFIVNVGRATAADILALVALVRQRVYDRTGYDLETEVQIIGEP